MGIKGHKFDENLENGQEVSIHIHYLQAIITNMSRNKGLKLFFLTYGFLLFNTRIINKYHTL